MCADYFSRLFRLHDVRGRLSLSPLIIDDYHFSAFRQIFRPWFLRCYRNIIDETLLMKYFIFSLFASHYEIIFWCMHVMKHFRTRDMWHKTLFHFHWCALFISSTLMCHFILLMADEIREHFLHYRKMQLRLLMITFAFSIISMILFRHCFVSRHFRHFHFFHEAFVRLFSLDADFSFDYADDVYFVDEDIFIYAMWNIAISLFSIIFIVHKHFSITWPMMITMPDFFDYDISCRWWNISFLFADYSTLRRCRMHFLLSMPPFRLFVPIEYRDDDIFKIFSLAIDGRGLRSFLPIT